jgi:TonB family protein
MTRAAIRSDWVGRVIDGRFPLLKWLGGSEWSGVFLTKSQGSGPQKAAIKLIQAKDSDEKAYLASWAAAATLSHPHLMRLLDTGHCEIDGAPLLYAVTEYAEEVLSEIIVERPLKPDEVKEMLVPTLDALFYLHGKGFVHGHLKPSNIMAVGNQVKLSADSLELARNPVRHLRAVSVYDAPEIGSGAISPAADVWSLGVTLVEALTQQKPAWDRSTNLDPVASESMPQPFARIAQECLRVDPARRCTLADVNKARFEQVRTVPEPTNKAATAIAAKPRSMRLGMIIAAGAVLLVIAVILVLHGRAHRAGTPSVTGQQQAVQSSATAGSEPAAGAAPVAGTQEPARTQTSSGTQDGAVDARVLPDVPQRSLNTIHGTVKVEIRVAVDASGNVTGATFESAGPSRYFANLAMDAARRWRFKPAEADGRAVGSVWTLRFQFQRAGTEVVPVETTP